MWRCIAHVVELTSESVTLFPTIDKIAPMAAVRLREPADLAHSHRREACGDRQVVRHINAEGVSHRSLGSAAKPRHPG